MKHKKFPCTSCGSCCRRVGLLIVQQASLSPTDPLYFPYDTKGDGMECEKLVDGLCGVYENRPLICNIDGYLDTYGGNRKKFYKENAKYCNKWMEEDGVEGKRVVV